MQFFKVSAWPIDPIDWKDRPTWETIVSAMLVGEAYDQGVVLFRAYCAEMGLEFEQFQIRSGSQ